MKEVIIHPGTHAELVDSPVPTPKVQQVVIKVVVTGINQKDWKFPDWTSTSINQGDDIAGTIHAVGSDVLAFKPGDRVAALYQVGAPGGSYAEYAVAWDYTTCQIPSNISFSEAATLPLCYATAALALYQNLRLPPPFHPLPSSSSQPLIIHGASSAVGSFAIKLACASNIHPIIAICGAGAPYVHTLLDPSKGDAIVDYRNGGEAVVSGIREAIRKAGCKNAKYAFDATTADGSWEHLAKAMDGKGKITFVLFEWQGKGLPEGMELTQTHVGVFHGGVGVGETEGKASEESKKNDDAVQEFASVYFGLLSRGLRDGWMKPHPHTVFEGGLENGVGKALGELKAGKASAMKFVVPI
ncbi:MAG: hypothetical protein Q9221_007986 [Calogaya cf. arnoldii]